MKKTEHVEPSPGPWEMPSAVNYEVGGIPIWYRNTAGFPVTLAQVRYLGTADVRYAEANARAIAAVPKMLEALRFILKYGGRDFDIHLIAREALQAAGIEVEDR